MFGANGLSDFFGGVFFGGGGGGGVGEFVMRNESCNDCMYMYVYFCKLLLRMWSRDLSAGAAGGLVDRIRERSTERGCWEKSAAALPINHLPTLPL